MVTASYCTPEMQQLHSEAQEAGVTIVNEVGLDPGIDHLLALDCFDEVRAIQRCWVILFNLIETLLLNN